MGNSVYTPRLLLSTLFHIVHERTAEMPVKNHPVITATTDSTYDNHQGQHRPCHSSNSVGQGPAMNTRQRAPPRHANAVPRHSDVHFCPGCGKPLHNRTECAPWGTFCYKCDNRNHFANVCWSTTASTNFVANVAQPLSRTDADLCNDTMR